MYLKKYFQNKTSVDRAVLGLIINMAFAAYNGVVGIANGSVWFLVSGFYYLILGTMHFIAVLAGRGKRALRIKKHTGILLTVLSLIMVAVLYICINDDVAKKYGTITMITIATYTFFKLTVAVVKRAKHKSGGQPTVKAVQNIRYAEVAISVFNMQQSMLVSFGSGNKSGANIFNLFTGIAVAIFILALGIYLIISDKKGENFMAKSKLVKANQKVAEKVVKTYKKIENGAVGGYKQIENTVVKGYTKIEDAFVDKYLTKEGETVEEAKKRLKNKIK